MDRLLQQPPHSDTASSGCHWGPLRPPHSRCGMACHGGWNGERRRQGDRRGAGCGRRSGTTNGSVACCSFPGHVGPGSIPRRMIVTGRSLGCTPAHCLTQHPLSPDTPRTMAPCLTQHPPDARRRMPLSQCKRHTTPFPALVPLLSSSLNALPSLRVRLLVPALPLSDGLWVLPGRLVAGFSAGACRFSGRSAFFGGAVSAPAWASIRSCSSLRYVTCMLCFAWHPAACAGDAWSRCSGRDG